MANVRAERLLKTPAEPSPELRIPGAAAQTRVVSRGVTTTCWSLPRAAHVRVCPMTGSIKPEQCQRGCDRVVQHKWVRCTSVGASIDRIAFGALPAGLQDIDITPPLAWLSEPAPSATPRACRRGRRQAQIPAEPSPGCVSPALQLKREWSPWPEFGSDPGNPHDLSKG